jgi:SAM-dependent methyltransferase
MAAYYEEDLAYIHHAGFHETALGAAPEILQILADAAIDDGLVVDLGCGGGVWLRALIRAGYSAIGVDPSPAFIALARKNAPEAALAVASAQDFDIPPCAAVTAIGEVLCYVQSFEDDATPIERTFQNIHDALAPGGLFLFDIIVSEPGASLTARSWKSGVDWAVLSDVREDAGRTQLTRQIITFRKVGTAYRRSSETHRQRLYPAAEIETALQIIGFDVETSRSYGDFDLLPRRMSFVCRKKAA